MAVNSKTKKATVVTKPLVKQTYHFFNEDMDLYLENNTEEEFLNEVMDCGSTANHYYYRVATQLMEKIKIESKVVKV